MGDLRMEHFAAEGYQKRAGTEPRPALLCDTVVTFYTCADAVKTRMSRFCESVAKKHSDGKWPFGPPGPAKP